MEGAQPERLRLSWVQPQGLVRLSAVNFVLRILTLGFYNFWGKTEVRKRIWSAVRIDGEPLHYSGTGKELFLGFLIVFFLVVLPILLLSVAVALTFSPESGAFDAYQVVLYAVVFFLTGFAIYRAQRYRLSRTTWRAIRASLAGTATNYARHYFLTGLLIPLTLGWIIPWRSTRLQALIVGDMRFGDRPFRFSARVRPALPELRAAVARRGGHSGRRRRRHFGSDDGGDGESRDLGPEASSSRAPRVSAR